MSRCGGSRISKTGASTQKGRKLKNKIEKIVQLDVKLVSFSLKTRMYSSRMRTVRCSGRLLGVSTRGSVCPRGVSAWGVSAGGCLPGVSAQGVSAQRGFCQTPPCEQNHRQVLKTLPCHNYVADGNDVLFL